MYFIFAVFRLSQKVAAPINKLNLGIKQILQSGDLNIQVDEELEIVETHELSKSFNKLVMNLGASRNDLEILNRNLETKVIEKPQEISDNLENLKMYFVC